MLRNLIYQLLHYSPLRLAWQVPSDQLRVLAYHDVQDTEGFRWQMNYLQKHFQLISAATLEAHLQAGTPLPPRSVLITFDDAYPNVYYRAFPILKEAQIPAVLFLITDLVETDKPYWWDEIPYYAPKEWSKEAKEAKVWEVKTWTNAERIKWLAELKANSSAKPLTRQQLTWAQLQEMNANGIAIANHTHRHPILDQCTASEVREEINTASELLARHQCSGSSFFAYPNGNMSSKAEAILKEENYRMVFLFDHQVNEKIINPLRISRLSVNPTTPPAQFKFILSGAHSKLLTLKKQWR